MKALIHNDTIIHNDLSVDWDKYGFFKTVSFMIIYFWCYHSVLLK